jgi:hypothetical protein
VCAGGACAELSACRRTVISALSGVLERSAGGKVVVCEADPRVLPSPPLEAQRSDQTWRAERAPAPTQRVA